jgi:glycosyltransferase involved in cell wall biosynthesis
MRRLGVTMEPLFHNAPINPMSLSVGIKGFKRFASGLWHRTLEYKVAMSTKPDLFITAYPNFFPRLYGVPRALHLQDLAFIREPGSYNSLKSRYWRWSIGKALAQFEGAISISAFTRQDAAKIYGDSVAAIPVIHHGVAAAYHSTAPQSLRLEPLQFVGIGAHHPRKRWPLGVEIIAALREKGVDAWLDLIGPYGADTEKIEATIAKHNLNSRVRVLGVLPQDALVRAMKSASALLWTSSFEGFGFPVAEAMAAGVPVFSVSNSSIPEITAGAYTQLLDAPQSAADAIITALNNPAQLFDQTLTAHSTAQRYTWERAARETLKVWEEIARK